MVFAASQWGLVIAIARLAGAEALGVFALANALISPVFAFASLGLRPSLATDVRKDHPVRSYLLLYTYSTGVGLLVASVVLAGYQVGSAVLVAGAAFAFARAAENASQLSYGLFQHADKMASVGRSLAVRGLLGLLLPVIVLLLQPEAIGLAIAGMAIAWLLVLVSNDIPTARPLIRRRDSDASSSGTVGSLFRVVAPLGALALISSLILHVPRLAVSEYLGARELGFFAAVVQIAVVGSIVVNAIGQAAVPRLAQLSHSGRIGYLQLLAKTLALTTAIGLCGIVGAVLFGNTILSFVYSSEFGGLGDTLVATMFWSAILYVSVTLGCAMSAMRSFSAQLAIGGVSLAFTVVACFWWVPLKGLVGAAHALSLGAAVKVLLQIAMLTRRLTSSAAAEDKTVANRVGESG